jgi:hypothetical protein
MKTLKFAREHIKPIQEGRKRFTLRKKPEPSDPLITKNETVAFREAAEDGDIFAYAAILLKTETTPGGWAALNPDGYADYADGKELANKLDAYYPEADIGVNTRLEAYGFLKFASCTLEAEE